MSRTLFWYIFADLFRIFMMTSGALAGIMSFGGMLRPLTQGGLDAGQVMKMMTYLSPAMTAYSFPIAALFATTVVYGRLSADNEIVAARAGGISFFVMSIPALVLGLVVAIVSMLFLCFVVPNFTLKVEKIIYSNIAQIVASQIERNHQMRLDATGRVVVYAQEAHVLPPADGDPSAQRLVLVGPMIVNYRVSPTDRRLQIPTDFYTARQATVHIRQSDVNGRISFSFNMEEGMALPRESAGGSMAGIDAAQFGPIVRDSMIKENTKFMELDDLKRKFARPWTSEKVKRLVAQFVGEDQQIAMSRATEALLLKDGRVTFAGGAESYELSAGPGTTVTNTGPELVLTSPAGESASVLLRQTAGAPEPLVARCRSARLRWAPLADGSTMRVEVRLRDVEVTLGGDVSRRASFVRTAQTAMPPEVKAIERNRTRPDLYAGTGPGGTQNQKILGRELVILKHDIIGELHSRMAFAVSCLVLVVVGCVMGMIFQSGNFLTAFAVSFIPTLFCITLIVAGQRTCGNVSWYFWNAESSLRLGVGLIWTGNVLTGALGGAMLWRLQRT